MSEAENDTIRLQGLALGYPGRTLFENVDLSFGRGELTALIGRNGTGKSTLLRTIMGLLRPLRGSILIGQKSVHELPQRMIAAQISFVSTDDVRMGHLKVYDVVGLGRAPYTNRIGRLTDADRAAVNVQFSAAVSAANSIVRAGNLFYLLADNAVECFDASGTQQ